MKHRKLQSDLAQARQQAVAEISKFVRAQEPTLGPHTFSKIQGYLRSLTPPPALTAKNEEFAKKNLSQPSTIFGNVPDKEGPR